MSKSAISEVIFSSLGSSGCKKGEADKASDAVLNLIADHLRKGEDFVLPGIGRLTIAQSQAREARNPSTGEKISVPAGKRIKFKASPAFTREINGR